MAQPSQAPRAVVYALAGVVTSYALVGLVLSQLFSAAPTGSRCNRM